MRRVLITSVLIAALGAAGCVHRNPAVRALRGQTPTPATYGRVTTTQLALRQLPAPERPVAVAVYAFTDQTGQFQRSETGQTLSRAVSQGGGSMLMRALQDAGGRSWFTVIEREQVAHLLQERQIIREMRERYLGEQGVNPAALPALLFAGVILEGGVVGYDSNTLTGGAGAAFLGIGGRTQYRQDTVTVYLRAVSTRTGEVLTTVTASKTIASVSLGASAFRYVGFRELLEAEAGITTNEPDQLALQQAIEKAVYALVMEGAELNLWQFRDRQAAWPMLWRYQQERDGVISAERNEREVERAQPRLSRDMPPAPPSRAEAVAPIQVAAAPPPPAQAAAVAPTQTAASPAPPAPRPVAQAAAPSPQPARQVAPAPAPTTPVRQLAVAASVPSAPRTGLATYALHRVARGETLTTLARRYRSSPREIAGLNGLAADTLLVEGRELRVPLPQQMMGG